MNESTLEQYFIEDYKRLKAENDELKSKLATYEANAGSHEYGITDLHQRFKAVKGSVTSSYQIKVYGLKNGKLKLETAKKWIDMGDAELFESVEGKYIDYSKCIDYEEHEFQYTLAVKESRAEWVARTDGTKNSSLYEIGESDFDEGIWIDANRADDFKVWLAQEFRENVRDAIADWEKELAKKAEESGDAE